MKIDPRDENRLLWYFNDSAAELDRRGCLHGALERQMKFKPVRRPNQLNGGRDQDTVYVGSFKPSARVPELPDETHGIIEIATAARRIRQRLEQVGPEAFQVLRYRFREVIPRARLPFDPSGKKLLAAVAQARKLTLIAVRAPLMRGPGNVAGFTDAARTAYAYAASKGAKLDLQQWVDELGARLGRGVASPNDRALGYEVARQALRLVLWACECYAAAKALPRPEFWRRAPPAGSKAA